jgi:hypothetical protein
MKEIHFVKNEIYSNLDKKTNWESIPNNKEEIDKILKIAKLLIVFF